MYDWNHCDYRATQQHWLTTDIKPVHEEKNVTIWYSLVMYCTFLYCRLL